MKSFIRNSVKFWLALSLISTLHFAQLLASRSIFIELTDNELVAEPIKTGPFLEENGLLIMEMESTQSPLGLWIKKTDAAIYDFKAGETYTLTISGRSQRFNLDRIVLRHSSITNTVARDASKPESQRDGSPIEPPPVNHLLLPAINFPVQAVDGFIPFYIDSQRACLAVNSILYPNQFAAARSYFNGTSGTYDVTITTLSEIDGEPSYKLRINGNYVGSPYTQPYTGIDYSPLTHTWSNVPVKNGDTIQVESNNVSNGLVPEGDAFAFARGRWTQLELTHITTVQNDFAGGQINVFPNPGNGLYKLNASGFPSGQSFSLKVVDALGRNIQALNDLHQEEGLNNFQIDLSEKTAGIYFILLMSNTNNIYSYKEE